MTLGDSTKCCTLPRPETNGPERYAARAKVMKAMAHPSRLMLVDELSRGERCVCDLTNLVGHDISTVSKHLAVLKKAGLVEDERRGKQVFYRMRVPCVLNFFQCLEAVLAADR
ncbi:ArsR/SmtB family transcription factor [Paucidesulfovibrio longus]|uniref:ArsR/SmtB family transcription factor n=1 Tax=Paucidesulfovibrio longus TaxID=889 RepID=UPI0003B6E7FA|nr:metalloregulator ArsR/SmtB family transcription factor [Paucidesulfovibrio longus]